MSLSDVLSLGAVVFNTLKGKESSRLQQECRRHDVPHTGNAHTAYGQADFLGRKDMLRKTSVRTIPYWRLEANYNEADDMLYGAILDQIRYPVVISPLPDAFSVDAVVVESEAELMEVLHKCFSFKAPVTVSDTYEGNVYAVVVMDSFRGQSPYAFPPRELLHDHEVANAYSRDNSTHKEANHRVVKDVEQLSKEVFSGLHLRDIAEVNILQTPEDELYVLDVDPHPNLDRHSILLHAAGDVGATLEEVLTLVVKNAKARSGELKKAVSQL